MDPTLEMKLDMNVTAYLSEVPLSVNDAKEINAGMLSAENVRGRDVIIINPYTDGGGDHALAKRIANIALDEGCRVTINSLNVACGAGEDDHKLQSYSLHNEEPHHISDLKNPLFIISPVSISNINKLEDHLKKLSKEFHFQGEDVILVEEMDLLIRQSKELINYTEMLKKIGFSNISENKLGFACGSIGYLPTDEKTINEIKSRFENELIKLLDGHNVSLSRDCSYHLGYISSNLYVTGTQLFVSNTLCEIAEDERNAIFIMSLRQFDHKKPDIINAIKTILETKIEEYDYVSLFSKATITVMNPDSGEIESRENITGRGTKKISIIITNTLPKNIYDDFMMLADTGMASGDQSLSEYLSLKGKLPYYDMQPWKRPLVESIKKLGGQDLQKHLENKIVGIEPFSGKELYSFIQNTTQLTPTPEQLSKIQKLDKTISSYTATQHISNLIRSSMAKGKCKQ